MKSPVDFQPVVGLKTLLEPIANILKAVIAVEALFRTLNVVCFIFNFLKAVMAAKDLFRTYNVVRFIINSSCSIMKTRGLIQDFLLPSSPSLPVVRG